MNCACGQPLHYTDRGTQMWVEKRVRELGEHVAVQGPAGRFLVQRHYLALHGIKHDDLPALAEQGIVERVG